MVWRQPQSSCNNGLPIRRPSPVRAFKGNCCFDSQLRTPEGIHHTAYLHHNEFAPTPNRFSILAGLNPSPETKWAFDFIPTPTPGSKRRGKRGGKQQRRKQVLEKTHETPDPNGLEGFCGGFGALYLDDNEPTVASQESHYKLSEGCTSAANAVRHHWAPQFRPNSLPTSRPNVQLKALKQQKRRCLSSPKAAQDALIDILPSKQKVYPRFPLSAFLKDLASPNGCVGDWPPSSPACESASPLRTTKVSSPPIAATSVTLAQPAIAACCTSTTSRNTITSFSNAIGMHHAVSMTPSLSARRRSPHNCFPVPSLSAPRSRPASVATMPPASTIELEPTTLSAVPYFPQLASSPVEMPVISPTTFRPFATSVAMPPASTIQPSLTARPPRQSTSQKSPWGWQEVSEGITIFHTTPSTLITAPVTSPYPFVYPPRPWIPTVMSTELSKDTASAPSMPLNFAASPFSPKVQKTLEDFLDMGHADDCWCSRSNHEPRDEGATTGSTTVRESAPISSRAVMEVPATIWRTSNTDVASGGSQAPHNLPDLQDDIENSSSDSGAVLTTPSSELSWSLFEDLMRLDQISQPIDSDDDEWVAVSRCLRGRRPSSLSSCSASDALVLTPNTVANAASPVVLLPSLPQTPLMLAYQARVSDVESEIE
ncbi:hypothetical protein M3J09_005920 [Ascochyta lentis]